MKNQLRSLLMVFFALVGLSSYAQTTLNNTVGTTGYTGSNSCGTGSGGTCFITFVIENSSGGPIFLTDLGLWTSTAHNATAMALYYSSTSLSGAVSGAFSTTTPPAGWNLVSSGTISGITATGVNTVLSGMTFLIPANTTYRFAAVPAGTVSYSGPTPLPTPNTVSSTGVHLRAGDYQIGGGFVGYGGANNPRFFTGSITFVPAGPCINPPYVGAATSNKLITCSGEQFNLGLDTLTFGSGQTFQWQSSPDGTTWTNITGATNLNYSTSQTTTTYYRCGVTCTATVYSSAVQVTTTAVALPGGTYTINGGLATGGTNFNSFTDFRQAIVCGGIAGPVVVNVINKGSAYAEQVSFGQIGGTSATNTITINGNGQTITSTGGAQYATMLFNGASHFKLKDLKIEATGTTNSFGLHITGGADNIEIDSCTISANATVTTSLVTALAVSGSLTSATTAGASGKNIKITNCDIAGGYYGITLTGPSGAPFNSGSIIANNHVHDFYLYGIYSGYQDSTSIRNNNINRANRTGTISTFYGIYHVGNATDMSIVGNRIHSPATQNPTSTNTSYPLFLTSANATAADPMLVANNAIYNINTNGLTYGVYLSSGNFINFYHNTVSIDNTQATTASAQRAFLSFATTGTFDIKNNLFSVTHGGTAAKHVAYFSSTVPSFSINYNQYHLGSSAGTNFISYWNAANVNTFADWQAVNSAAFEQNGVNGDPVMDTSGYKPQSAPGNSAGTNLLASVPTDLVGAARTATPDIGALEYTPLACLQPYGIAGVATLSTVTLTWTNVTGADSVRIEYGGTGFVQGTGTALFVTGDSTVITGLNSQTCYDFYLTTYCGGAAGNGFALYTICTPCGNQAMPYTEPFTAWPPQCFTITGNSTWTWIHNATGYAVAPFWSYSTGTSTMKTANVAITAGAQVKFKWAHAYNATYPDDRLVIRSKIQSGTAWDTLVDFIGPSFNSPNAGTTTPPASAADFVETIVYLPPTYIGQVGEFEIIGLTDFGPHVFIDEFTVEQVPPCTPPIGLGIANITATGAQATWSTISGTCFDIEYGPQGFIQGTGNGTLVTNVSSPYTISNLTPNTFYDVYVRDCCNPNVWVGPVTFKTNCLSQLSGIYTVGGTPSATNFATLDSAIAVLTGCGVSGPVTFNLQGSATKTIGAKIFGVINGASATNTVTFNGRGIALDSVVFAAGSSVGLTFNGTKYIKFQNMTINGSGTSITIRMYNNAQFLTFENCDLWNNPTTSTFSTAVIAASNSATSATTVGDNASNITVKNCKIVGGYYGISVYGLSATTFVSNFTFEDNEFVDQYYYGISMYYAQGINVTRNTVPGVRNTFGYGYYGFYNSDVNIKQSVFMAPTYGLYISQFNAVNPPTVNSELSNNFFGGGTYGAYFPTYGRVNFWHNSLRGGSAGFYGVTPSNTIDIRNNIFVGGSSYAFYNNTNPTGLTLNYNIYHTTSANLAFNGVAYATLAAWQTGQSGYNVNSLAGDPGYLSNTDFHIVGTLPNNVGQNGLATVDIDNAVRPMAGSTIVDIGADEFTPLNWDASLEALLVSTAGCGDSTMPISVVVKNFGLNTITSLPISVALTGGITTTVNTTATVNIPQGATDTVSAGTFNAYAGAAMVNFAATLALVGDQKASNDTKSAGPGNYVPFEPLTSGVVDTVCANGDSVDLYAVYIPGTSYAWYDMPTGGTKIANGDTLTVPANGPTTYYVEYDSATANPQIGNGTLVSTSTYITPYKTFYMDGRAQYLVLASEMAAMGVSGGGQINSLAFDVVSVGSPAMNSFEIKMGGTSVTSMTTTFQPNTGMTTVFTNASLTPTTGWNVHQFSTPFIWNGSDNILIEVCYDNNAWSANSSVNYTVTPFNSATDGYADLSTSSGCTPGAITNQQASGNRPNMQFNMKTIACSNIRKPVSFAINPNTANADYSFAVQANGADVNFDASASTGHIYDWTFGDGGIASGVTVSHTYANGNTYNVCLIVTDTVCNSSDTICKDVLVTVGIDEGLIGQSLNVFPNPNDGKFRIEFQVEGLKNVELRVLSIIGEVVYSNNPGNVSGSYREDIDLSNFAAGVYVLQILSEDGTVSRRVTVRK